MTETPAPTTVEPISERLRATDSLFSLGLDDRYSISMRDANRLVSDCRVAASLIDQQAAEIAGLEKNVNSLDQERDGFAQLCAVRTVERNDAREQADSFKAMYRQACDWRDAKLVASESRAEAAEREIATLREAVERVRSDREYIIGWNAGFEHAGGLPETLTFPTMLRKMWSGHEVQSWIDEHLRAARALTQPQGEVS